MKYCSVTNVIICAEDDFRSIIRQQLLTFPLYDFYSTLLRVSVSRRAIYNYRKQRRQRRILRDSIERRNASLTADDPPRKRAANLRTVKRSEHT